MTFRVPSEQDIRYTPDTSELLKFAWIQPVAEKKNNLFCFFALLFEYILSKEVDVVELHRRNP